MAEVLSRFVHWGYWDGEADRADLPAAMERLNAEVLAGAELADGQVLLDAGCGFGGTLSAIAAARKGMRLTGLNIDERQLAVAREKAPGPSFVVGDACSLPFPEARFDRVLAVECIFHFPSRLTFLKEAARVLRPGGRLTLSDFVPPDPGGAPTWWGTWLGDQVARGYGLMGTGWPDGDYAAMARAAGLEVVLDRDITENTMRTYPALIGLLKLGDGEAVRRLRWATRLLEWSSRFGLIRYRIVAFNKPAKAVV